MKTKLTTRNLEFKRDTTEYLMKKFFNEKYFDYRSKIIDVFIYRDAKKIKRLTKINRVETIKKVKYEC